MDLAEVALHNSKDSCWIIIDRHVYDVTSFLASHPGGRNALLTFAGRDATEAFMEVHSPDLLEDSLAPDLRLGPVVPSSKQPLPANTQPQPSAKTSKVPPLISRVVLEDFSIAAKQVLSDRAYTYVNSHASKPERHAKYSNAWENLGFRPRAMRDVSNLNTSRNILSLPCSLPVFIPPMGLLGMIHPDGETLFARASVRAGIHYCISTATSKTKQDIMQASVGERNAMKTSLGGNLFFQLYVHSHHNVSKQVLRQIRELSYSALLVTVDTPVVGKRTTDRRLLAEEALAAGLDQTVKETKVTAGRAAPGVLSTSLNWNDLRWIRKEWPGPIVIKGIQSATDAAIAASLDIQGIYLSNHGGRQLPDAPSCLDTLLDIWELDPSIFSKVEVFVDGGFDNGSDVVKALCLGATAVGIGRPLLYAAVAYGEAGVTRAFESQYKHFPDDDNSLSCS